MRLPLRDASPTALTTRSMGGKHSLGLVDLATASSAVLVAAIAWRENGERGRDAVLMGLAALPFVAPLILRGRMGTVWLLATVVPAGLFALDGGPVLSAVLPAMALVRAVPVISRDAGIIAAVSCAAVYIVVAVANADVDWAFVAAGMAAAWAAGSSLGNLDVRRADVRDLRKGAADEAVHAERRRLARELHDLVAHALTGTLLSLTEIRLLLDGDRAAVLRALDNAERLARASLSDLRGTVRLLSEDGDPRLEPPIELDTDLARLIEGYRLSGVVMSFATEGQPLSLSVASAWCVYRIVQESLTNAVRHAPGTDVDVRLAWRRDGVRITTSNGRAESAETAVSEGHGLLGMSERAGLLGGYLEAGPTASGWVVTAWVPSEPRSVVSVP